MEACKRDRVDVVEYLLECGADPEIVDDVSTSYFEVVARSFWLQPDKYTKEQLFRRQHSFWKSICPRFK